MQGTFPRAELMNPCIFVPAFLQALLQSPKHIHIYSWNWQEALRCPWPLLEGHETKPSTFLPSRIGFVLLTSLQPQLAVLFFLVSLNATYFKHVLTFLQLKDNK